MCVIISYNPSHHTCTHTKSPQENAITSLIDYLTQRTGRRPRVVAPTESSSSLTFNQAEESSRWRVLETAEEETPSAPSATGALCVGNATTAAAGGSNDDDEGGGSGEEADAEVVLELDNYGDLALVELLLGRVIRGEEQLTTEDGVPVQALLCSAAYTSGTAAMSLDDDDAAADGGYDDDDKGNNGGNSTDADVMPNTATNAKPRRGRMRAMTGRVAGGIAAAVVGTLLVGLIVVFRGQLRRRGRGRGRRGGKVLQAGANVVGTVAASSLSPPPPSATAPPSY